MKKWLKSLFKGSNLNEIEEEFDEKPSDARVFQSHSIEMKKQDEFERPNFRFPLQLDDDITIKEEQQIEVEPVFQKPKNYDFWQTSSQTTSQLNREEIQTTFKQKDDFWQNSTQTLNQSSREKIQPTYKQKEDFWQNSTQSKNQSNVVQSVYNQKNNFSRNEVTHQQEQAAPEVEEKVDIVFRPKRKTPFRPSEYISPIYGYQKPDSVSNQEQSEQSMDNTHATEQKEQSQSQMNSAEENSIEQNNKLTEVNQVQNEMNTHEVDNDPINILIKTQSEVNKEETVQASTSLNDKKENGMNGTDSIVENAVQVEDMPNTIQSNVNEEIADDQDELITQDVLVPLINECIEVSEVDEFIDSEETTNLVTSNNELTIEENTIQENNTVEIDEKVENDFKNMDEENGTNEDEDSKNLQVESVKNELVNQAESNLQVEDVSVYEEVAINKQNGMIEESSIQEEMSEENKSVLENEQEISTEVVSGNELEQLQNEHETNVEQNDAPLKEADKQVEVSQTSTDNNGVEKTEKKRNFPFNVMMLRSDVEASKRAKIMRQLREMQDEAATTLEKVNQETERKVQTVENTNPSLESEIVKEQYDVVEHENGNSDKQIETTMEPINANVEILETQQNEHENEVVIKNNLAEHSDEGLIESLPTIETPIQPHEEPVMPPVLYELPELGLLTEPPFEQFNDGDWVEAQKELLQETLQNFNVGAKVIAATQGPTVTRFEVQPDPGVKVNKITNLQDDIKLSLAARDIRIEAPIPGRSAIGIEVPNRESKPVYLRELVSKDKFLQSESPLTVALGLDIGGEPVYADISKMPHGLIAGATGSGKSVCINSILVSILYKAKPHEVKLILIDPKMVELAPYNHIPHLLSPVITDARAATAALKWACDEMDRRYDLFAHAGARDIKRFNDLAKKKGAYSDELPYLVIVIDELADLMMVSPGDVETYICRIAQKARACGIHLLVATQRPSVDVITGIIKSNIPTRIAFTVSSQVDSRTIIDIGGAEKLLGRGDMLFLDNGKSQAIRLQGVYVSDDEIEHVVEIVKDQQKPNYLFNQEELVAKADAHDVDDELFEEAVEFVIDQKGASVSMLQRRFRIGYNRAARLVDLMFDHGIVSNQNGSKPRDVLMTLEQFHSEE